MFEAIECHRKVGFFAFAIRLALLAAGFVRGEGGVDEWLARTRGGYLHKTWGIAAKKKSAPGPDLSDFQLLHHSLPHQWAPYDVIRNS